MHVCVTIWTNHPNNGACDYSPYWLDSSVILPSRGLVMCPSQLSYSPKRSKKTLELKLGRFIQSVSWFSRPRLTEKSICMGVWNASFCFAVYDFDIYPFSNLQKCPWNAKISVFSQNWKIWYWFSRAMNSSIISNWLHDTLWRHLEILPSNTSLPTSVLRLDRMHHLGGPQSF